MDARGQKEEGGKGQKGRIKFKRVMINYLCGIQQEGKGGEGQH